MTRSRAFSTWLLMAAIAPAQAQERDAEHAVLPDPPPKAPLTPELRGASDLKAQAAPGDVLTLATFDADAEGFLKRFDCSTSVSWNGAGYVESGDECFHTPPPPPGAGCVYWFWEAPGSFVSPAATDALGGILSYDLKMNTSGTFGANAFDVAILGGNGTLGFHWITLYGVQTQLHSEWRSYSVALDTSSPWVEWGNPSSPIPPDIVEAVLSNVSGILFRGAYRLQCEIGNGSAIDNVKIVAGGGGAGGLSVDLSSSELAPSDETGWYEDNPITVTAILTCPAGGPDCPNPFSLSIDAADGARFYYLGNDLGGDAVPVECEEALAGTDYSHGALLTGCIREGAATALTLFAGETKTLRWRVWVQPSDAASLSVTGAWGGEPVTKTAIIHPARIHPAVFVHGILGSQPPVNSVIEDWPQQQGDVIDFSLGPHLDPFIGSYKPLIDNLLRMGYEMKKTLFPITYDWRQSNVNSAAWLRRVLETRVGAHGASALPTEVTYASPDGKADVIVHSMGGLVLRTYVAGLATTGDPADSAFLDYQDNVHRAVFIATPHRGFPFDYETLHDLSWHEYTDDQVPGVLGSFIADALSFSTDRVLWPYLIMCRYAADPAEPCNNPAVDLLGCNTTHSQALYDYSRANPFDPSHPGIGSLREMLPDKWSRKFLAPKNGTTAPTPYLCDATKPGCVRSYGQEPNFLLDNLGLNGGKARRSLRKLGSDPKAYDGVYVLYNRDFETVRRYRVSRPDPLPPPGLPLYPSYRPTSRRWHRGGEPDARGGRESRYGDGLIPHWSTRLFYGNGLLAGQLTGRERREQELHVDDADHVLIMTTQQTQSVVGAILTGSVAPSAARDNPSLFPIHSPYEPPVQILNNLDVLLSFLAQCPVSPTP